MEFQHRLYDLRRKAGMSQEELATVVGVTRQAVQKWESGASKPDMENLTALARYFSVSLDWLITGAEAPSAAPPVQTIVNHYCRQCWEYEYQSQRTLWGLPLVHIHFRDHGLVRARGIIALGNVATGLISCGIFSTGVLSLGVLSLGLLSLGCLAAGLAALGCVAIGTIALGGIALGWLGLGGLVYAIYGAGGVVEAAEIAVGAVTHAPLSIGWEGTGSQFFSLQGGPAEVQAAADAIRSACGNHSWLAEFLVSLTNMA